MNTSRKMAILAATLGLAGIIGGGMVAATAQAQGGGGRERGVRVERHPEIRRAMRNLELARNDLQKGAHDFSGHRAKALELTNKALEECRLALASDKK